MIEKFVRKISFNNSVPRKSTVSYLSVSQKFRVGFTLTKVLM